MVHCIFHSILCRLYIVSWVIRQIGRRLQWVDNVEAGEMVDLDKSIEDLESCPYHPYYGKWIIACANAIETVIPFHWF